MTEPFAAPLPHQSDRLFVTDGGLETSLIYLQGVELPHFSAVSVMMREGGEAIFDEYFRPYVETARRHRLPMVLESPTWRAGTDWAGPLGVSEARLMKANQEAVAYLHDRRRRWETAESPMLVSGNVGPRGDGYRPDRIMKADEAEKYHSAQIAALAEAGPRVITAMTITNSPEAIGIIRAAVKRDLPVVISFTVETDGRLPTGQGLFDAIGEVDRNTGSAPAYYMVNCAHTTHFDQTLRGSDAAMQRIRGLRANASAKSHAELDSATELDRGDADELSNHYSDLLRRHPHINVLGGCCGTDHHHIAKIIRSCVGGLRRE